jgi:hypothetical protein
MIMQEFSAQRFAAASNEERADLSTALAESLAKQLRTGEFHARVYELIDELRGVGHDLWSIDEGDDFQVWGPNDQEPKGPGLVITFRAPDEVTVEPVSE